MQGPEDALRYVNSYSERLGNVKRFNDENKENLLEYVTGYKFGMRDLYEGYMRKEDMHNRMMLTTVFSELMGGYGSATATSATAVRNVPIRGEGYQGTMNIYPGGWGSGF